MPARRPLSLIIAIALAACLPEFEDVECYINSDCLLTEVCEARVCIPIVPFDSGVIDPFEDGGAEPTDTGVNLLDAGVTDARPSDIGFADAGDPGDGSTEPTDALPLDAGPADAADAADAGPAGDGGPADPTLTLAPDPVNFGVARIGCPLPIRQITLQNQGPGLATIDQLGRDPSTSGEFQLLNPPAPPFVLIEGDSLSLDLQYSPANVGIDTGMFRVVHGVNQTVVTANLQAEGVLSAAQTNTFRQEAGPIDILFVIDNSATMIPFQNQLGAQLSHLFLVLPFEGWDYQIGVTSTDVSPTGAGGALIGNPAIITANTPNPEMEVANRVRLGDNGSSTEQGLEATRLALSPPLINGVNAGFLRPDAALLIFYLADEDEHSPMFVAQYTAFLEGLKGPGNEDFISVNPIVSVGAFCSPPGGGDAFLGERYLELRNQIGGTPSNICDSSWFDAMTAMPPIPRNPTFPLDGPAEPASIQVRINNNDIPSNNGNNWRYDAPTQSIIFTGMIPEFGDNIEVDYQLSC